MAKVTIYGHSDDCIEVEGALRDEFSAYDCWKFLHFSDGTVVKVGYDQVPDKGWHIEVVKHGTASQAVLEPEFEDGDHYTDRLELSGDITSMECWRSADGPDAEDVETFFENLDHRDYDQGQLCSAMQILTAKQ